MTLPDAFRSHATERLGLHLSEERLRELERFVSARSQAHRRPVEGEFEEFLNGETYFFRYPFFLTLLAGRFEAGGSEPFRVLCPACSTGDEVYSIAFALAPLARPTGRRLEVVGTDVRRKAVRAAREGVFGVWSLRNTRPAERPKYFEVAQEGRFRVKDEFRPFVRFGVRNLLEPVDDGLFDAVALCNATLYMHETAVRTAYANIRSCLKPDGLLLIAPTDPPPSALAWRHCPEYGGWSIYRPIGADAEGHADRRRNGPRSLDLSAILPASAFTTPAEAAPPRRSAARTAAPRRGRSKTSAPAPVSRTGSRAPTLHPSLWSVQPDDALLWSAWSSGKLASVEPQIREKVFFEPDNPLWRFLRGVALWEMGWLRRAQREIDGARRLLDAAPPQVAVSGLCSAAELSRVIDEWSLQHG